MFTVLLTTNRLGIGGAEQQILTLAKGIDKQRFHVIVATLYPNLVEGPVEEGLRQTPGVELVCLNRRGKFDFLPMLRLFRLLRHRKVDIVQSFLTPATLLTLVPAFFSRTPVKVVTERSGIREDTHWGFRMLQRIEDYLGNFAQIAVANSVAGQSYLIKRGYKPERTRIIYNGINFERLAVNPAKLANVQTENRLDNGNPVVGISATLRPAKDHYTFLESARIIHESRPDVRFAILGDGVLRPNIEARIRQLNIAEQVILLGLQEEVGTYLSLFNIAVTSSKDEEGCSNSILEAMALGKPVVATDIGGNRELVIPGENGFIVPPGEPKALAEAVLSLLNDPERGRQMGERGQAMVFTRFNTERMVADYQDLWLQLLQERQKDQENICPE